MNVHISHIDVSQQLPLYALMSNRGHLGHRMDCGALETSNVLHLLEYLLENILSKRLPCEGLQRVVDDDRTHRERLWRSGSDDFNRR